MNRADLKATINYGLPEMELRRWTYQHYIKDYLEEWNLTENTLAIYTLDQGLFLGDHGWYDKRFMYEESLRMPFLVRYPNGVSAGQVCDDIVTNVDFAQTFLDYAGIEAPQEMQGHSIRPLLEGEIPSGWQDAVYHRYWMHRADHNVAAHYGIRTKTHKLIYYYADPMGQPGAEQGFADAGLADADAGLDPAPEWELFDLERDPLEMNSVYDDRAYSDVIRELTERLHTLQAAVGDERHHTDSGAG